VRRAASGLDILVSGESAGIGQVLAINSCSREHSGEINGAGVVTC